MSDKENEIFMNENSGETEIGEGTYIKETRVCGIRGESSADFLLPDYMGDIKRLLKYGADVSIANKFAAGGEISFLLLVTYRVMYLDFEDNLTEASFTSDYECTQRTDNGFIDADIESKIQNLTVRLQGPRKICAKASIISEIRMSGEANLGSIPDVSGCECKTKSLKIHKAEYVKFPEREYAEEIGRLDGISADEAEIIKCDALLSLNSCRKNDSSLVLSGDVNAFALLRVENDIIRVEKKLPFEETISVDEKDTDCSYTARGYICSVSANVNNAVSDSADAGVFSSVVMNFSVECYAVCDVNEELKIITDAYMCGKKNECSYRNFAYNELLGVFNEKKKISITVKRDGTPIRNILDYDLCIKNTKWQFNGSDVTLSSSCEYNFAVNTMQPLEVCGIKGECDFEEKIRLPWQPDKQKIKISVTPCEVYPSFDSEKIYISFMLSINAYEEETKSEKMLSELKCEDDENMNGRFVIVYYPGEKDTVWSVAKKYATSVFDIMKHNDLSDFASDNQDESVASVSKLLIVKNSRS